MLRTPARAAGSQVSVGMGALLRTMVTMRIKDVWTEPAGFLLPV